MSQHIHSWVDGQLALRERAYETRGAIELGDGARWPRTTGTDVIAIAALVDPAIRTHGTPGVVSRWHAARADLARDALTHEHETYPWNRTFWASFESAAIFLDDVAASPPPPAMWDALLAELATFRNAGPTEDGPFVHFDGIHTYDEMLEAQRGYLAGKRGSDQLPPPTGFGGGTTTVPRTTNADVLQLATYWSDRLTNVKHEMGHDGIVKMWQAALGDVDKIAKPGKPDAVYTKNSELWASARRVAVQVAISDEAPTKWDLVVSSVKDSVAHLPENLEHAASVVGDVAKQTGKGLLAGLGAPVLIGAGLIGLFLFSRGRHQDERSEMRTWPWLVGGGLAAYALARGRGMTVRPKSATHAEPLPGRWVWPVPTWMGRSPTISDGFGSPRPGGIRHGGVDLMFERLQSDTLRAHTPNGSAHHVMPDDTYALAASDGVVWSAMQTPRGFAVVIDHSPTVKVATFYTHLEKLLVTPTANAKAGERVRAGQPIGIIGADPLDGEHLKHLHFELWRGGPKDAVDPAPIMCAWSVVPDPRTLAGRNRSFVYRPVGATGAPYPQWVRDLREKAGVYIIRDAASRTVLYVGSSAGALYGTMTRHFQKWRRWKAFWKGQYDRSHDPGLTYDRDSVEVAVRLTPSNKAFAEETRLIYRLAPRDNWIGHPTRGLKPVVPF